ncbi:hypothetical protein CFN78_25630 [Amycolatopsis antarctica]|uniref:Uncharacterized protein n=2 Tax=Amycolatopsis antarctica TaxID=1854586 RepID=A0A263CYA4_9PSEU|nr:hypothetical protein CFN78_25630 [Amycolatopsis antarctica]
MQTCVDRFARALFTPSKLMALHPRKQGHPGNAAALAPAITLGVISAFEGFVEDFLATVFYLQGQSFGQIAKKLSINNPDVGVVDELVRREFPELRGKIGVDFSVDVWSPPGVGKSFWLPRSLNWEATKAEAAGWMQVRHCLTHGLASGWGPEVWPGPTKNKTPPASSVLRRNSDGKHSLGLHGAITCARVYVAGARHVATVLALEFEQKLFWKTVPDFPLKAAPVP